MRALALALLFSGCSSILGLDDGVPLEADGGIDPPDLFDAPVVVVELHVDPAGDDADDGSVFNPFRTITHAVSQAQAGWIIHVAPGTYNEASGESFPIVAMAPDVEIAGPVDSATPAVIAGDPGVFEIGASFLHDVELSSASGTALVISSGARVERCTISAPTSAAISSSSLEVILNSNQITNSAVGITIDDTVTTGATSSIADNIVVQNQIGMFIRTSGSGADLSGGNELSCNTDVDLNVTGGGEVFAPSTIWDHDPPTRGLFDPGNPNNGIDIADDGATIVTAGDQSVSNNPCP